MANPNPPTEQLKPHQWKPGQTGNPLGRTPTKKLQEIIQGYLMTSARKLADPNTTKDEAAEIKTRLEEMLDGQWEAAKKGNPGAFRNVMDFGFGKAIQQVKVTGNLNTNGTGLSPEAEEALMEKMGNMTDAELNNIIQSVANGTATAGGGASPPGADTAQGGSEPVVLHAADVQGANGQ